MSIKTRCFTSIFCKKIGAIALLAMSLQPLAAAQDTASVEYFPKNRLFAALYLDPNEAVAFGAVTAFWQEGKFAEKAYLPLGFGFYKPLIQWKKKRLWEFGMDLSAHLQFEWTFPEGGSQRNLLNADYKISFIFSTQLSKRQQLRIRGYHVSSHLGDDYMLQNGITSYFTNPNNYEQADVTWSSQQGVFRYYGGVGLVVRPDPERKRLSLQFGSTFDRALSMPFPLGFIGGVNVKMLAQNDFNPGVKAALGMRFGEASRGPFQLVAEFYRGNLPYSPYEFQKVKWLGLSLYFSPG
jgi:hypothetical protein